MSKFVIVLFFSFLFVNTVQAIVIKHNVEDEKYRELAKQFNVTVNFLGHWNNQDHVVGSGTLISRKWVVTAAHVATHMKVGMKVQAGGEFLKVKKIIVNANWQEENLNNDIALVQLSKPTKYLKPVALYRGKKESGKTFTFIGSGKFGNGIKGPIVFDAVQRAATNEAISVNKQFIQFRFDKGNNALALEGISGSGDSGGPGLIVVKNKLYLAGISSWQDNSMTDHKNGRYGVIEHYTRVSTFVDWIESNIEK